MASAIAEMLVHITKVTKAITPIDGKTPKGAAVIGNATKDIGKLTSAIKAKLSQNGGNLKTSSSLILANMLDTSVLGSFKI